MGDGFLYEQIAGRIAAQIRNGLLSAGNKLPSVRALSREQGISLSTAYQVYMDLENKGLIEARTRSGYYVKALRQRLSSVPVVKPLLPQPQPVTVSEMITAVFQRMPEEQMVSLSRSAPPVGLLPVAKLNKSMLEALRNSHAGAGYYETLQGHPGLCRQIAKNAFNSGCNITADDVVTTQGCMEALVFCLRALTKPGDTVAIESPTYFGIFNIMLSLDLKVLEIPADTDTGPDLDYLEQALETIPVKVCLFVTNFSNPTGSLMPDANKRRLVQMLSKKQIPLIEDDIYGEIYFGGKRPVTCRSFDTEGMVLLCSSVSKSLAPGYRVGWCLPGKYKEQVMNIKMMHTISSATPTQAAIANFFETGRYDLHLRKLRKALHLQCLRYTEAIAEAFPEGTRISEPQGGYVLWIELHARINAFRLFQMALEKGISIAPGQVFSTDARFSNFIRISFGEPLNADVAYSIETLGKLVAEYPI